VRDGRRRGAGRQAGAHLGCWPEGGCPVPARLASGPANQAFGIVAAAELTSYTVPGRHECGAGIRGLRHDGRRWLRTDGRWPGAGASDRWQAADFEQLEPERLDLREHAIQRGAVGERPGQHGVATAGLSLQGRERGAFAGHFLFGCLWPTPFPPHPRPSTVART